LVIEELHVWAGVAGAVFVVGVGWLIRSRQRAAAKREELAANKKVKEDVAAEKKEAAE
jgi:hypothetical protein